MSKLWYLCQGEHSSYVIKLYKWFKNNKIKINVIKFKYKLTFILSYNHCLNYYLFLIISISYETVHIFVFPISSLQVVIVFILFCWNINKWINILQLLYLLYIALHTANLFWIFQLIFFIIDIFIEKNIQKFLKGTESWLNQQN